MVALTHTDLPDDANALTGDIIDTAIKIHRELGPGLYEGVYEKILARQLARSHHVERQAHLPIVFDGEAYEDAYVADLIVDGRVVVEVKAVEALAKAHFAQLATYVRLGGFNLGLLLNFDAVPMKAGIRRFVLTEKGRSWS